MKRAGFTLIEILVVLAVVGILLAIGFSALTRYIARTQFNDAQQVLVQALNRARDQSRRTSQDQQVSWKGAAPNFQLRINDIPVTLPHDIKIKEVPSGTGFKYKAPYGRVVADDRHFTLLGRFDLEAQVRVFGVTGKVVRDAP